jgi:hypothetical protein
MTLSSKGKKRAIENGLQKSEDQYGEARNQIEQMSFEQLTTLRKVLNPSKMHAKLANARATLDQYNKSIMKSAATFSQNSPDSFPGVEETTCGGPVSTGVIIASDVVYFIAELVRDLAQDACNQVVVAVAGGNTRLACIVTDTIYVAAHAANQAIHFCDDDYAGAVGEASFERLEHIHSDLENSVANDNTNTAHITSDAATNTTHIISDAATNTTHIISDAAINKKAITDNDNTNKNTIVANDDAHFVSLTNLINATRTAIINNANDNKDEVKNLLLRTQIEADLSSTDSSVTVALYETPSNVCLPSLNDKGLAQLAASFGAPAPTQCGLLDMVRSIVRDTIANVGTGTGAQAFFNSAVAQQSAGKYKAAYALYRQAYKAASK